MKTPRFSIFGLMMVVLILALSFGVARALLSAQPRLFGRSMTDLIVFGALPMATILALGCVPFLRYRSRQGGVDPSLVGFEVFGAVASVLFLSAASIATDPIHDRVGRMLNTFSPYLSVPPLMLLAAAILLGPQLALAAAGAWFGKTYRVRFSVSIGRRHAGIVDESREVDPRAVVPDGTS